MNSMDSTTTQQINLMQQIEQDCAAFCGVLKQIRTLFSHDPKVVRHSIMAEDSIFKMTEVAIHNTDIESYAAAARTRYNDAVKIVIDQFWSKGEREKEGDGGATTG
jgi:hypothetical protein